MTSFTHVTDLLSGARRRDARAAEEFAALLERSRTRPDHELAPLVDLARGLAAAEYRPEPTFRAALRAQLVAEAVARVPATPAGNVVPVQRAPEQARPSAPRWRSAVAAVAVASAVSGVGAAAASSHALPGDALYGLKLRVEAIQLSVADSDLDRGRELLEQAEARLGEAERLAGGSPSMLSPASREELSATLARMDVATAGGAAALARSYEQTGDPEPMVLLSQFVARLQPRLQDLSVGLDPQLRARVLRTVDSLALLGTGADALLVSSTSGAGEAAGHPGRARVDGHPVSGQQGRGALPPSAATGTTSSKSSGSNDGGIDSSDGASLLDGLDATATGTVATGTGSSVPSVTSLPAASTTEAPLPQPTVPVPSVAPTPTPSVSAPVPTPTAVPAASASVAPAPVPTCVPVPPLASC